MVLAFVAGIFLIYLGAEILVRGGASLALRFKIPPLVIGLTVIALGTSSPELFVSLKAIFANHADISVGDIVGSNIFNTAGILSVCAIFQQLPLKNQILKFDLPITLFAYVLLSLFSFFGIIPRWAGVLFILLIIGYILAVYFFPKERTFFEKQEIEAVEEVGKPLKNVNLDFIFILGGISALIFGSNLFIEGAIHLAKLMGLDDATIGLSIVAISTSLPEVSASIVALKRKKFDLLVGNIIGSNIFNIFGVLGIASLVHPIKVSEIEIADLSMMFLTTIFLFPFFQKKNTLPKIKGAVLFFGYLVYLAYLWIRNQS